MDAVEANRLGRLRSRVDIQGRCTDKVLAVVRDLEPAAQFRTRLQAGRRVYPPRQLEVEDAGTRMERPARETRCDGGVAGLAAAVGEAHRHIAVVQILELERVGATNPHAYGLPRSVRPGRHDDDVVG